MRTRTRTLLATPTSDGSTKRLGDNTKKRDGQFRKPPQSISNPDYWVRKSNKRKLTKLGKFFKHALDPLVLPVVDRPGGWLLVSVGLFVVLLVGQLYAGELFKIIYPFFGPEFQRTGEDDDLPFLQPFYELCKWILDSRVTGPFPA